MIIPDTKLGDCTSKCTTNVNRQMEAVWLYGSQIVALLKKSEPMVMDYFQDDL